MTDVFVAPCSLFSSILYVDIHLIILDVESRREVRNSPHPHPQDILTVTAFEDQSSAKHRYSCDKFSLVLMEGKNNISKALNHILKCYYTTFSLWKTWHLLFLISVADE
jgi:hypothetical protein